MFSGDFGLYHYRKYLNGKVISSVLLNVPSGNIPIHLPSDNVSIAACLASVSLIVLSTGIQPTDLKNQANF